MILQKAISRTREYAADEMGARISGEPMSLASALAKIAEAAAAIAVHRVDGSRRQFDKPFTSEAPLDRAYLGLAIILYVSCEMIYRGAYELESVIGVVGSIF